MVVLGKHVDHLKFFDIMLGDEPALKPEELTYQRMLAGDPIEVAEQAQKYLKEKPLLAYYQDILSEALKLAQADADRGNLDEERKQRIRDVVEELLDDLEDHQDTPTLAPDQETADTQRDKVTETIGEISDEWRVKKQVLCVPGRGLLGEAFALIIAQLVSREGIGVRAEHPDALTVSRIFSLDTKDVKIVCLCFVGETTGAQVQYAARRLRRKMPQSAIVLTLIGNSIQFDESFGLSAGVQSIQTSLSGTRSEIWKIIKGHKQPQTPLALVDNV
jgi:hypothetical protein